MTNIVLLAREVSLTSVAHQANGASETPALSRDVIEIEFKDNLIFGRYRPDYVKNVLDLSAEEMAKKLGLSYHTWRSYETKRRKLPKTVVDKLEALFREELAVMLGCTNK